jgi:hypothetical protein
MPIEASDFTKLPEIKGRTYIYETVLLDGTSYQNCVFTQCHLIYRGGPTRVAGCSISSDSKIEFLDAAACVYQTLGELGWKLIPPPWI